MKPRAFVAVASFLALAGGANAAEPITSEEFVSRVAKLGMAELAGAKLAGERSESEAVQKHANEMIVDHTVANDELSKIAAAKGWPVPQPADEPPEIASLAEKSGAAFDAAYVEMQVRGHEEMLGLLEPQAESGQDPRLREYAAKQIPVVRKHLEEAKGLLGEAGGGKTATHPH
jgi:putative membrane protein